MYFLAGSANMRRCHFAHLIPRSIDPRSEIATDHSRSGIAAAAATMILWSAGNIMVRSFDMPGVQIAFWRILLSASLYWLFLRARGRTLTLALSSELAVPTAIAISVEIAVFFVAIKQTTVANATIIGSLQPIVLLAVLSRFGEKVTARPDGHHGHCGGRGRPGGCRIVEPDDLESPRRLLSVVALVLFSAYFFYAKKARATVPAFEFQTAVWIIGAVTLLPVALIDAGGSGVAQPATNGCGSSGCSSFPAPAT